MNAHTKFLSAGGALKGYWGISLWDTRSKITEMQAMFSSTPTLGDLSSPGR
jgi:hypothetical protein